MKQKMRYGKIRDKEHWGFRHLYTINHGAWYRLPTLAYIPLHRVIATVVLESKQQSVDRPLLYLATASSEEQGEDCASDFSGFFTEWCNPSMRE